MNLRIEGLWYCNCWILALQWVYFYPSMTEYQKSALHKWAGDSRSFNKMGPYIELMTSLNNPADGFIRHSCVNKSGEVVIYGLAYFWPQYTPFSSPTETTTSLFIASKSSLDINIFILDMYIISIIWYA
ncbi:Pyridoxal phosphate-dependent transferase, major region, subdomain [Parasponia andersonii]|uniref:Pyridoxal phosphate-dependent transferase, major region, subdomain n=1 Tax=Parasponia andersonii TaxID=3476 RepID=A0A2P5DG39_PARAD|nr:Pyridoxal phosphate-dependent transferase, major region, subdomain [Parasponia andersonii]